MKFVLDTLQIVQNKSLSYKYLKLAQWTFISEYSSNYEPLQMTFYYYNPKPTKILSNMW